jgi:hypothetical protein
MMEKTNTAAAMEAIPRRRSRESSRAAAASVEVILVFPVR